MRVFLMAPADGNEGSLYMRYYPHEGNRTVTASKDKPARIADTRNKTQLEKAGWIVLSEVDHND